MFYSNIQQAPLIYLVLFFIHIAEAKTKIEKIVVTRFLPRKAKHFKINSNQF